jgi:dihydroorotate dehydrogenase
MAARDLFLSVYEFAYQRLARPLLFRQSAGDAHEQAMRLLRRLDGWTAAQSLLRLMHRLALGQSPIEVGGVHLSHPLILAAGFVKGQGFASEGEALAAVERGEDIIPGWRSMPSLVGAVEFGSFTRWPRLGNAGTVMWRDVKNASIQNRVGLKNPGALGAAAFLARYRTELPEVYGLNIAVSPGVDDIDQQCDEVSEAIDAFRQHGLRPSWFTLNLSCPNTEDDPGSRQTAHQAAQLCDTAVSKLNGIPLWVKVGPDLADTQYGALMRVFQDTGVKAVVVTNTLGQPAPDNAAVMAGVGGRRLHACALHAAERLMLEKRQHGYTVDVIGCGGVLDGATSAEFTRLGVKAMQYWSALIYRGPLAAALIAREIEHA